jgi:hypothetical protein
MRTHTQLSNSKLFFVLTQITYAKLLIRMQVLRLRTKHDTVTIPRELKERETMDPLISG